MNNPTSEPIFAPAIIVRDLGEGTTFQLDVYDRPGKYGKADPKATETVDSGDTFEYRDYKGRVKLIVTVQLITPGD